MLSNYKKNKYSIKLIYILNKTLQNLSNKINNLKMVLIQNFFIYTSKKNG